MSPANRIGSPAEARGDERPDVSGGPQRPVTEHHVKRERAPSSMMGPLCLQLSVSSFFRFPVFNGALHRLCPSAFVSGHIVFNQTLTPVGGHKKDIPKTLLDSFMI